MSVKSDRPIRPGFVNLAKDDLLFLTMKRAPCPDAPLHRAPDAGVQLGVASSKLLEDTDRPQPRRRLQQRHDFQRRRCRQADLLACDRVPAFCATAGADLPTPGSPSRC